MDYLKSLNIFTNRNTIPEQIRYIYGFQNLKRSVYSSTPPNGDLSGPTSISSNDQEVSTTYLSGTSRYLSGFYHMNK